MTQKPMFLFSYKLTTKDFGNCLNQMAESISYIGNDGHDNILELNRSVKIF